MHKTLILYIMLRMTCEKMQHFVMVEDKCFFLLFGLDSLGAHLWKQVYEFATIWNIDGFYGAMFGEVDEGTAWMKVRNNRNDNEAVHNTQGNGTRA